MSLFPKKSTIIDTWHYGDLQAFLRMDNRYSKKDRTKAINDSMHQLGLTAAANNRIGSTLGGKRGLSGGEKKRLSFASEVSRACLVCSTQLWQANVENFVNAGDKREERVFKRKWKVEGRGKGKGEREIGSEASTETEKIANAPAAYGGRACIDWQPAYKWWLAGPPFLKWRTDSISICMLLRTQPPYSGFHFLCSFFRTVADSRSFVLKLCGLLEKIRHGLPSSPISKKIRKEDQFLRKFALIRSPICGGILGMQERHVCTIQRRLPSVLLNHFEGATTYIASYS